MARMTQNKLLRILRIQTIDIFFTSRGFSRRYVYQRIINPIYFISERTYHRYMEVNAKKLLNEQFQIDWKNELNKNRPMDIIRLMENIETKDIRDVPEYLLMLQEGAKR